MVVTEAVDSVVDEEVQEEKVEVEVEQVVQEEVMAEVREVEGLEAAMVGVMAEKAAWADEKVGKPATEAGWVVVGRVVGKEKEKEKRVAEKATSRSAAE